MKAIYISLLYAANYWNKLKIISGTIIVVVRAFRLSHSVNLMVVYMKPHVFLIWVHKTLYLLKCGIKFVIIFLFKIYLFIVKVKYAIVINLIHLRIHTCRFIYYL